MALAVGTVVGVGSRHDQRCFLDPKVASRLTSMATQTKRAEATADDPEARER
jgi:hypothetical protein